MYIYFPSANFNGGCLRTHGSTDTHLILYIYIQSLVKMILHSLTLLHIKIRIAFDALLAPHGVKIERRYFLTIPKYTYKSV